MRRSVSSAALIVLIAAACSRGDAGAPPVAADIDPVATFCTDWQRFATLTNSDRDPTPVLVREVVELQDEMGAIVPQDLDAEWASILEWNAAYIDYFETAGYDDLSDDVAVDLFGGEAAAGRAFQARADGYEGVGAWARQNCADTGDDAFCQLWPAYDEFMEEWQSLLAAYFERREGA